MIVAGPEGFRKSQYRKFNIRSAELTPGDDFAMMREVLERRFKRLLAEAPKRSPAAEGGEPQSREPGEIGRAHRSGSARTSLPRKSEESKRRR